jgi:protein O-GlcNAc transferase
MNKLAQDPNYEKKILEAETLFDAGQVDKAERLYREAITAAPGFALGHYKLGVLLSKLEREDEAITACRDALRLDSLYPEPNCHLGQLLARRHEWAEAELLLRRALAERVDYFHAHQGLGNLLLNTGRDDEARYHFSRAATLEPGNAEPFQRLGEVLRQNDRPQEAIAALSRAVELKPKFALAWNSLGGCYLGLSEVNKAVELYRRASDADPDLLMPLKNIALAMNYIFVDRREAYEAHLRAGQGIRKLLAGHHFKTGYSQSPERGRRLRVGFVSGDFRGHSVSYFMLSVLRELDHRQFEYHAYFTAPREDIRTREFHALFHHWHKVHGMPHHKIAQLVRRHQIDILIDLSGYTSHTMTEAFVLKPAPIQIAWIGYPNTVGLPEINYRLTDDLADPVGESDAYHSEKLLRVPGGFLCYAPYDKAPPVAPAPFEKNGFITFGSFNQRTKLSPECIALWSSVLRAVPDSTLVLKSVYGYGDGPSRDSLLATFSAHGVGGERLRLLTGESSTESHLARYAEVDIGLDTIPFNGTTTSCEALWMGVPVVCLAGDRHASRVGVSILTNAGLPDLIAKDSSDFIRIACDLAADRNRLKALRSEMRDRLTHSPLLDAKRMARHLESIWRDTWWQYCETAEASVREVPPAEDIELKRLNIGGTERRSGWVIVDVEARDEVDEVADILDLLRFADASCSEIYCSHVLQCLPTGDVLDALQELHRILVPGGTLYLAVPDMETLSGFFADPSVGPPRKFQIMREMFGLQQSDHDFNRTGLSFDLLLAYLGDVGFSNVDHVESFGMFSDSSEKRIDDVLVSLNLRVTK